MIKFVSLGIFVFFFDFIFRKIDEQSTASDKIKWDLRKSKTEVNKT